MFSQMKDTEHIRWDFTSVAWVMSQGWDFGVLGVLKGPFFQTRSCGISNQRERRAEQNASKIHPRAKTCDLGVGSNIIKFRLPCQTLRFLY